MSRRRGLHVLGAALSDADYGPISPAQLANLDRALTPAEQKAVDDYQSHQADAMQAAEEKKGGPKATATITTSGGTVTQSPTYTKPGTPIPVADTGRPMWQYAVAAVAVVAAAGLGWAVSK